MNEKGEAMCPRCWKLKVYWDFHLSGGSICSTCFAETNPDKLNEYRYQPAPTR